MLEYLRLYIELNLMVVGVESQNRTIDWGAEEI